MNKLEKFLRAFSKLVGILIILDSILVFFGYIAPTALSDSCVKMALGLFLMVATYTEN